MGQNFVYVFTYETIKNTDLRVGEIVETKDENEIGQSCIPDSPIS